SQRSAMRSRAVSLPAACWRSMRSCPPPSSAVRSICSRRARRSDSVTAGASLLLRSARWAGGGWGGGGAASARRGERRRRAVVGEREFGADRAAGLERQLAGEAHALLGDALRQPEGAEDPPPDVERADLDGDGEGGDHGAEASMSCTAS